MVNRAGVLLEPREFPCDFFLWGYIKDLVENAATTICNNTGMLERMEESFRQRLHYCIDNNGAHFEHFV
jgi:hypothetical protein